MNDNLLVVIFAGSSQCQISKDLLIDGVLCKHHGVGSVCSMFITMPNEQGFVGNCCSQLTTLCWYWLFLVLKSLLVVVVTDYLQCTMIKR